MILFQHQNRNLKKIKKTSKKIEKISKKVLTRGGRCDIILSVAGNKAISKGHMGA